MTNQQKAVGNRAQVEIHNIATHGNGPASAQAFLWAGFDDLEKKRLCRLSQVSISVGTGEFKTGRVLDDWFDFSVTERAKVRNTLEILAKLGRKFDRLQGLG